MIGILGYFVVIDRRTANEESLLKNAIELPLMCNSVVEVIAHQLNLLDRMYHEVGISIALHCAGGEAMKSTTLRQNTTKNILIIIGVLFGILILNSIMENVASFLAFYFA